MIVDQNMHTIRILLLAALYCVSGPNNTRAADECDVMVATMVSDFNIKFERRTELGTIHLKHPAADALSIDCTRPAGRPPSINLARHSAYPEPQFFALVGRAAGVVLKRSSDQIELVAKRCQRDALADAEGDAEIHKGGLEYSCSSFTQRGGGTHISIRLEPKQ